MNWINNPLINKAEVSRSADIHLSKFYKKLIEYNGMKFNEEELKRLEEIRKELIKNLNE